MSVHSPTPPEKLGTAVWVLVGASFVIALGYGIVAPVLPLYAAEFGVSLAAVSALISVFALMRLLFAPLAGFLVQRWGEKTTYLTGLLIVAVSTGACALAAEYWQVLALRAVAGIGSTMFTIAAMGLLVRISPPHMRARVSSLYSGGFLIGGIVGPVLGAAAAVLGLRWPFIIYAVFLFIAVAFVGTTLRGTSLGDRARDERPLMPLRSALAQAPYRAAVFASFTNGWSSFGVRTALVPLFMAATFISVPSAAALALTAFALGNAAVIIPAGHWSDRYGRKPFIIGGLLLTGGATALLGYVEVLPLVLALCLLGGVGVGLFAPSQQAVVADVIGRDARGGQVLAVFQMGSDLGAVIGPLAIGVLADAAGYGPGFAVTGALLLVAAVVWMAVRPREPRTETGAVEIVVPRA